MKFKIAIICAVLLCFTSSWFLHELNKSLVLIDQYEAGLGKPVPYAKLSPGYYVIKDVISGYGETAILEKGGELFLVKNLPGMLERGNTISVSGCCEEK